MDPERWQKLDELFHSALSYAGKQREAYVAAACDGEMPRILGGGAER